MLSIGLMGGTSMDGIDVALLETDGEGSIVELDHVAIRYSSEERKLLKAAERAIKKSQGDMQQAEKIYPQALYEYLTEELRIDNDDALSEIDNLKKY